MKQLRERLLEYGSQKWITEELLALVLRTCTADEKGNELTRKLLAKYGGLGRLLHAEGKEITQEKGLSETRAALLKAVLELGKRLNMPLTEKPYQITTAVDVANLAMPDMGPLARLCTFLLSNRPHKPAAKESNWGLKPRQDQ